MGHPSTGATSFSETNKQIENNFSIFPLRILHTYFPHSDLKNYFPHAAMSNSPLYPSHSELQCMKCAPKLLRKEIDRKTQRHSLEWLPSARESEDSPSISKENPVESLSEPPSAPPLEGSPWVGARWQAELALLLPINPCKKPNKTILGHSTRLCTNTKWWTFCIRNNPTIQFPFDRSLQFHNTQRRIQYTKESWWFYRS